MKGNPKRTHKTPRANAIGRIFAVLAAACAFAAMPACASEGTSPLRNGESLTYSVRWGLIPSVGRITISAEEVGSGENALLRITTITGTWGIARGFFPFDAKGVSVYKVSSGQLISSSASSTYREKVTKNSIVFDYAKKVADYTDYINPGKSRTIPMPESSPSDLILALIQTRSWSIKPGEKRDTLVIFGDQFYPLTITAEDYDDIFTPLGVFKALALLPRMEKTPPKGMFRKGSTVKVWIETNDERHLPVRFSVGFVVGTGTATLLDYQPPK